MSKRLSESEEDMAQEEGKQNPPKLVAEIYIKWEDGMVSVNMPPNPLLTMAVLADAMKAMSVEYTRMMKQAQSPIIQPGLTAVDKRIVDAGQGNKA
jgi:hypothetical protein